MAIQFLRGTQSKVAASTRVLAEGQPLYETDTNKLKVGDGSTEAKSLPYVKVDTDSELSSTSTNPIQNKVVNSALASKAELSHNHAYLPTAGGTMTGAITTKGIKLTLNTDYGTTLPSDHETNQLFFQIVGTTFILDNVYPVGSIYMSVNASNPGTLFGGTWEQIQGKFLLGMSSEYPAGSEGGETTHTLTTSEIPSHRHSIPSLSGSAKSNGGHTHDVQGGAGSGGSSAGLESYASGYSSFRAISNAASSAGSHTHDVTTNASNTGYEGGGNAHNNMPPYLAIYMWKRTA